MLGSTPPITLIPSTFPTLPSPLQQHKETQLSSFVSNKKEDKENQDERRVSGRVKRDPKLFEASLLMFQKDARKSGSSRTQTLQRHIRQFFMSPPPLINPLEDLHDFLLLSVYKQSRKRARSIVCISGDEADLFPPSTFSADKDREKSESDKKRERKEKEKERGFVDLEFDYAYLYQNIPHSFLAASPSLQPSSASSSTSRSTALTTLLPSHADRLNTSSHLPPLTSLYARKQYLTTGLFYPSPSSSSFSFSPGLHEFDQSFEFEVPYDIMLFYEVAGGVDKMKQLGDGPTPFTRITKNIFIDRKARSESNMQCHCEPLIPAVPSSHPTSPSSIQLAYTLSQNRMSFVTKPLPTSCASTCINRCMFYECDETCPLAPCTNTQFTNPDFLALQLCHSPGRGYGLMTPTAIPSQTLICEYRGEIISQETCANRMETTYHALENYYFLEYANGEVLDGCKKGTEARFINHSCDPNCHIEKWSSNGEYHIGIFSNGPIPPNTELTYDYKFKSFGPLQPCNCQTPLCRGFIGLNKPTIPLPLPIKQKPKPSAKKMTNYKGETTFMIPALIAYVTTSQMKQHFRTAYTRTLTPLPRLPSMSAPLFLQRIKRAMVLVEMFHISATMVGVETPVLSAKIRARRERRLEDVCEELAEIREARVTGIEDGWCGEISECEGGSEGE